MADAERDKVEMARRLLAEADELDAHAAGLRRSALFLYEKALEDRRDAAIIRELRPDNGGAGES